MRRPPDVDDQALAAVLLFPVVVALTLVEGGTFVTGVLNVAYAVWVVALCLLIAVGYRK
jgi:hypothetical protein